MRWRGCARTPGATAASATATTIVHAARIRFVIAVAPERSQANEEADVARMCYARRMPNDPAYRAADPDDFPAMIEPARYADRSSDFEELIARTEEHFWNPEDPDYVDFAAPFPTDQDTIVPTWFVLESNTAVWDRLDEGQRIRLTNQSARWSLSNILHGEQGALS